MPLPICSIATDGSVWPKGPPSVYDGPLYEAIAVGLSLDPSDPGRRAVPPCPRSW